MTDQSAIQRRALKGDEDAMKQLQEEAEKNGEKVVVMQRLLQSHFHSVDGKKWFLGPCIWSPWHEAQSDEPDYYIDTHDGKAFRTIKKELQLAFVDVKYLDPEEIPRLIEKMKEKAELQNSLIDLQKRLKEAVEAEEYEKAAEIRDEIILPIKPRCSLGE